MKEISKTNELREPAKKIRKNNSRDFYKINAFWSLFKTELKLNLRDMNMVIFAIFMPLVLLAIFGFIYGTKKRICKIDFTERWKERKMCDFSLNRIAEISSWL